MKTHSAGGVVLGPNGRIIVVSQRGRSWSLPKGHLDPGEDTLQAAIREIREETGVTQLSCLGFLGQFTRYKLNGAGRDDRKELKTMWFYCFITPEVVLNPQDPDNPHAHWVSVDLAVKRLSHPADRQFLVDFTPQVLALAVLSVTTTFDSESLARQFATQAVEANLAACAQVEGPLLSIFRWEGRVTHAQEWRCTLKTTRMAYPNLTAWAKTVHPYQLFQWVANPVMEGDSEYLSWVISSIHFT